MSSWIERNYAIPSDRQREKLEDNIINKIFRNHIYDSLIFCISMLMINITTIVLQNNNIDGVVFLQSDCNDTSSYLNLIPITETQYTNDIYNVSQPYLTYPLHNVSDVEVWAVVSHRRYEVTDWNKTRRCIPETYIREDKRQVATTLILPAIYHNFSLEDELSNKAFDQRDEYITGDRQVSVKYNNITVDYKWWKDTDQMLIDDYTRCLLQHQAKPEYFEYKEKCKTKCHGHLEKCINTCLEQSYFSCDRPIDKKRLLLYSSDSTRETYNMGDRYFTLFERLSFIFRVDKWMWNFVSASITLSLLRAFIIIGGGRILIEKWYNVLSGTDIRNFERFMKIGNGIFSTLLKIVYGLLFSMLETILTKRCSYENESLQCGMNTKTTMSPLNFTDIQIMYFWFDLIFINIMPIIIVLVGCILVESLPTFRESTSSSFWPIIWIYILSNFIANGFGGFITVLISFFSPLGVIAYLITMCAVNFYYTFWSIANGYGFLVFDFLLEIPRLSNIELPSLGILYSPNFWLLFKDASVFLFIIIDLTSAVKSNFTRKNTLGLISNPLLLFVTGSVISLNLADYYRIVDLSHTTFSVIFILLIILPQPLVLAMEYLKKRCSEDTGGDVDKKRVKGGVTLNVV